MRQVVLFLLVAMIILVPLLYAKYRRRQYIFQRQECSLEEIYNLHFSHLLLSEVEFRQMWEEIGEILKLPASKLRPSDRFAKELKTFQLIDDDLDILVARLEERFSGDSLLNTLPNLESLGEYVTLYSELLRKSECRLAENKNG